mmetsp:Transcript_73973/g.217065  ORF Transcript_73973/g.217065 Transcript_73973/m.217065 type:complete len:364 (-) Transcript_73973:34-1125(-)
MAILAARLVLLACLVELNGASGRVPSSVDEVILIQNNLITGQKAELTMSSESAADPSTDPPVLTFDIGESVEVLGKGSHAGEWIPCSIKSRGDRPNEYTITVPQVGDIRRVKAAKIRRALAETGFWIPAFAPGERAEVFPNEGPFNGSWIQAQILGQGSVPNTYYINVPTSEVNPIPDVSFSLLRKLQKPVISGCSTVDRMQMVHLFSAKGSFFFVGWADRCENFMPQEGNTSAGVDYVKMDACLRAVFPISPKCSACGGDFVKEAMGPCSAACAPTTTSCASFTSPSESCMADLATCMDCTKPALDTLFQCVGVYDETIPGKTAFLRDAARGKLLAQPGVADKIFASLVDGLALSVGGVRRQ